MKKSFDLGFASFCNGADPDIGVRRATSPRTSVHFRSPMVLVTATRGSTSCSTSGPSRSIARPDDDTTSKIQRILAEDVPYFWLIDSEGFRAHRTAFSGFRLWTGAFVEAVEATTLSTPEPEPALDAEVAFGAPRGASRSRRHGSDVRAHSPGPRRSDLRAGRRRREPRARYADMRARYGLDQPLLSQFPTARASSSAAIWPLLHVSGAGRAGPARSPRRCSWAARRWCLRWSAA